MPSYLLLEEFVLKYRQVLRYHKAALAAAHRKCLPTHGSTPTERDRWTRERTRLVRELILTDPDLRWFAHENGIDSNDFVERIAAQLDHVALGERLTTEGTLAKTMNSLTPIEFENQVANTLARAGWSVEVTKAVGDQGVDVIASRASIRVAIQCKLYSSPVGNSAVQEIHAGKTFVGANFAVVVSNQTYTSSAKKLAEAVGVLLLAVTDLQNLDTHLKRRQSDA